MDTDLMVFRTREELYAKTALALVRKITELAQHRSRIHMGIAGGSVARDLLPKVATIMEHHGDLISQWAPVHLWMTSEAFVEYDHPGRSDSVVFENLVSKFDVFSLHRPPTPSMSRNLQAATKEYEKEMLSTYSHSTQVDPRSIALDISVLSIGVDGHFASLYPSHDTLNASGLFVAEADSPNPPAEQISMTIPLLRRSRTSWFVVSGKPKAAVFAHALQGANYREVPAASMNQVGTKWWADKPAASRVDRIF
ncbi:MAG: 6-phosphogluconolactonase [Actinomycetaceae bacterium]|nr:6-phosphogluconolactonase [Actinomycetaceae bacterium]